MLVCFNLHVRLPTLISKQDVLDHRHNCRPTSDCIYRGTPRVNIRYTLIRGGNRRVGSGPSLYLKNLEHDSSKHIQIFFGNRIRVLSGRPHVFILCVAMAGFRMICDIILLANIWTHDGGLLIIATKARWEMITASSVGPAADFVIAFSMCYCLWCLRKSQFNG